MGKTEVTLPPETRKALLKATLRSETEVLIDAFESLKVELPLPFPPEGVSQDDIRLVEDTGDGEERYILDFTEDAITTIKEIRDWVEREDPSLEDMIRVRKDLRDTIKILLHYSRTVPGEKHFDISISPTEEREIKSIHLKFGAQTPEDNSPRFALGELRKLASLPSLGQINISKDLVSSEYSSVGDILDLGTEGEKKTIQELQKKGKLLFGTLEGLSGGTAYFKTVSIALAKILNEQSKYYHPEEDKGDRKGGHLLSGVPKETIKIIREEFGETAKIENFKAPVKLKGEERDFPYILLSYEKLARELNKDGKITGGKDIEFVRLYINGGYREFTTDPKTGEKKPVKSSYTPGLVSKKYPISNGKGGFFFIPFVVNEGEIVDSTKKDPEIGCVLRLSPQYSKTLQGYTALRGDTIQLIGGGKQKEITMDLLSFLAQSRNTSPTLRKMKKDILSKYEDRPTYKDPKTGRRRPGKLEDHFKEAVQKCINAKILLPGTDSQGHLKGYREEKNSGGEIVSVFVFNPDYLKGEDILPDEQKGEE